MKTPFATLSLTSSITVIDESTTAAQAEQWKKEIEARYCEFFQNPEPTWTWNDVHDCDRDILIELEEVIRSSRNPPIDMDLVSSFRTPDWRKAYSKETMMHVTAKQIRNEYPSKGSMPPDIVKKMYSLREAEVLALAQKDVITVDDIQALERHGKWQVADELYSKCDLQARNALLTDEHPHVRSCAEISQSRLQISKTDEKSPVE